MLPTPDDTPAPHPPAPGAPAPDGMLTLSGIDEPVTLDRLAGGWSIYQLKHGHRFSTDDLMTAWLGAAAAPGARRLLDLGAGIGSVGLLTLWRLDQDSPELAEGRTLHMVEAQAVSHRLARHTVMRNGLEGRITALSGDLRDLDGLPPGPFDLITGSPPYIPADKGHHSPHPQRAACRMELRGSIFDYARAAARCLAPDGVFVVCFAGQDPRGEAAIAAAGLHLHARLDVRFRAILPPTICLLTARAAPLPDGQPVDRQVFTIRDDQNVWTSPYLQMRAEMGGPPLSAVAPVAP